MLMFAETDMKYRKKELIIPVDVQEIGDGEELDISLNLPSGKIFGKDDGVAELGELDINLNLKKYQENIYLTGDAGVSIQLQCSRCLADFDKRLEVNFNAQFVPGGKDNRSPEEEEAGGEDIIGYDGPSIELQGVLRDNMMLAMPIKPLCGDDCKGICPECGTNLNMEQCECSRHEVDNRLAILKKLKE